MIVLLSIKPKFAEKIFDGTKRYEFRRIIFKNPRIKRVVVYASSPISQVIGEFTIGGILCENVRTLWRKTQQYSGLDAEVFFEYFAGRETGYAIKIQDYRKYKQPYDLVQRYGIKPPQSFMYLESWS